MVQSLYNYESCNNKTARAILDDLVKQKDDGEYVGCQLRPLLAQVRSKL
jgi:hypothetical protein